MVIYIGNMSILLLYEAQLVHLSAQLCISLVCFAALHHCIAVKHVKPVMLQSVNKALVTQAVYIFWDMRLTLFFSMAYEFIEI